MRIRSIKPEFWRSDDISQLDIETRFLFIGLWSYVDDNGVGLDRLSNIVADLFADDLVNDTRETLARVSRGLQQLENAGLIYRYTVESVDYLEVISWKKHQRIDRPNKPRFPHHDAPNVTFRETLARVATNDTPGAGEQGSRGTGEQGSSTYVQPQAVGPTRTPTPTRFDEFWNHYPRKVRKDKARTAYKSACKRTDEETIITGAIRLANDPNLPDKQFIPHPTTWLNGGGWDDEPLPARTDGRGPSRLQQNMTVAHQMWEAEQTQTRLEIEQ